MRRMDRYKDETQNRVNRLERNQDLYQDIVNNPKVTNITDVTNANAYELNTNRNSQSARESYQQRMKYQGMGEVPKVKKELEDFNYLYPKKEKKIYDINSVLEEARKNRQEKDELEEKRKLKYTSYNILAGVNLEELAKYREEKKNRAKTPEEEEIHELMDTIASKTLAGEISKEETVELLSDLMATSILDKVAPIDEVGTDEEEQKEPEIISTETIMVAGTTELPKVEEKQEEKEESKEYQPEEKLNVKMIEEKMDELPMTNTKSLDKDFYTKSMDLSTQDLELEMADDFKDKGLPIGVKILIVLLILSIIAVTIYFVYLRLK